MRLSEELHWRYNATVYCIAPTKLRENKLYIAVYVHWLYFFVYYAFPFVALVIFNVAIYNRVSSPIVRPSFALFLPVKRAAGFRLHRRALPLPSSFSFHSKFSGEPTGERGSLPVRAPRGRGGKGEGKKVEVRSDAASMTLNATVDAGNISGFVMYSVGERREEGIFSLFLIFFFSQREAKN